MFILAQMHWGKLLVEVTFIPKKKKGAFINLIKTVLKCSLALFAVREDNYMIADVTMPK